MRFSKMLYLTAKYNSNSSYVSNNSEFNLFFIYKQNSITKSVIDLKQFFKTIEFFNDIAIEIKSKAFKFDRMKDLILIEV